MGNLKQLPCSVTIAGSDSGGGAGIQADLKTFAALGVHGTCVITCVTAQNPRRVLAIEPCTPGMVERQMEAIFGEVRPAAVKTGMLYSGPIIRTVARLLSRQRIALIVDPVLVSTSGASLLERSAIRILCEDLLPLATLITPNLDEAAILGGCGNITSPEEMRAAARALHRRFGAAALVKGGHLRGLKEAIDIFYDGRQELLLKAPYIAGLRTHGTGCTYSAAITAFLARGLPLWQGVSQAKEHISQAIAQSRKTGPWTVLGPGLKI